MVSDAVTYTRFVDDRGRGYSFLAFSSVTGTQNLSVIVLERGVQALACFSNVMVCLGVVLHQWSPPFCLGMQRGMGGCNSDVRHINQLELRAVYLVLKIFFYWPMPILTTHGMPGSPVGKSLVSTTTFQSGHPQKGHLCQWAWPLRMNRELRTAPPHSTQSLYTLL